MNRIIPAEERHIPELLRLLVQVNMVHHNGRPDIFKGPATKYGADELKALIASPDHLIAVCEETPGQILGYAMCELQETKESRLLKPMMTLYIDDICVDETARGRHVGRALFEYVKDRASRLGCYHLTLNVWELNPGARRFYENCGLTPLKTMMELSL